MKEERAKEILEELGWQGINKSNPADICRECERNPEISKEMHDLLCDVLTDCDIADGMRAEITRVVKIWEEESE